jgi:formate dehydrogenase major subunit
VLNVGRTTWANDRSGSMARRNYVLDALDLEPELEISYQDADNLSLAEGDIVRVTSERGSLEVKVKPSLRQLPGHAHMPWFFREAPTSVLTSTVTDARTGTPELKYTPIRVEFVRKSAVGLLAAGPGLQPQSNIVEGTVTATR